MTSLYSDFLFVTYPRISKDTYAKLWDKTLTLLIKFYVDEIETVTVYTKMFEVPICLIRERKLKNPFYKTVRTLEREAFFELAKDKKFCKHFTGGRF